jgi:hypothetical protein
MNEPKLLSVEPLDHHKLRLRYATDEIKIFDVTPYISGSWYGMLEAPVYFGTVHLIGGGRGIAWAEGQDIAPHELYECSVAEI